MKGPIAVSAPAKVLFTGGFLVLDRKHTGLVLSLDARIHVHIEGWKHAEIDKRGASGLILVQSPQFRDASWLYSVNGYAPDTASFVQQITE